jgi:hypothetical protein
MPLLIKDLHDSKRFLRWQQATEIGINLGIGVPYERGTDETWVVTLLSALNTPIARRFEIWTPTAQRDALVFHAGHCDSGADLGATYQSTQIIKGEGSIGRAWLCGVPVLNDNDLAEDASAAAASAREVGIRRSVVLPVVKEGRMTAALAWYL